MAEATVGEATLSNTGELTVFSYGNHIIRFRTSPHLERYVDIKTWDKGYIVCSAKYDNASEPEEEYIDLIPILENLYFDASSFLEPIQKVKVSYD